MPEQDNKERIEGQITESPSSNSFIERRLNQVLGEIGAIDPKIDPLEGEVLRPKSIGLKGIEDESESEPRTRVLDPANLSHSDSALGSHLRKTRLEKRLEKAA